jgi:tetratricopeptide (TPR) repeat protein
MRCSSLLAAALLALALAPAPAPAPAAPQDPASREAEFERRLEYPHGLAAIVYRNLALWLESQGMYEWALRQWDQALRLGPDEARYKKARDRWINQGRDPDETLRGLWMRVRDPKTRKVGAVYANVARWAAKHGLDARAREAWRLALRYDPSHAEARAALGFRRAGDRWRDAADDRIDEAYDVDVDGAPVEPDAALERALETRLQGRATRRIGVFADGLDQEQLAQIVRAGERALRAAERLFGIAPDRVDPLVVLIHLDAEAAFERAVDRLGDHDEAKSRWRKTLGGVSLRGRRYVFRRRGEFNRYDIEHSAHQVGHYLLGRGSDWFNEALSAELGLRTSGDVCSLCVRGDQTSAGRAGRVFETWGETIRLLAFLGLDPPARKILGAELDSLTLEDAMKGWSWLDMIQREHPEALGRFVDRMRRARPGFEAADAIFREALGVGVDEFDARWREWALRMYGPRLWPE